MEQANPSRVWRLGFKTARFQNISIFLRFWIQYWKHFVSEKSIGFGITKVSYLVLEKFGIRKKFRIRFRSDFGWCFGFEMSRFRNFSIFLVVSDSELEKIGIKKSIGFGIEKSWYRIKKSDSASEKFGIGTKFRIRHTLFRSSCKRQNFPQKLDRTKSNSSKWCIYYSQRFQFHPN